MTNDEIIDVLSKFPDVSLAILFGSMGRGEALPKSDLDLAVAAARPLELREKMDLVEGLAQISGRPVDLIDLQTAGEPISSQAMRTGKLIYCKDRTLYAELIKRMLFNEADFMPFRARIIAERRKAWING